MLMRTLSIGAVAITVAASAAMAGAIVKVERGIDQMARLVLLRTAAEELSGPER